MSLVNLTGRLERLAGQVGQSIAALDDHSPLKRWFAIELDSLSTPRTTAATMEELSARMRAIRQLHYMVQVQLREGSDDVHTDESVYTQAARNPATHLELVRQMNFSIEPELLLEKPGGATLFDLVSPTAKIVGYLRSLDESLGFGGRLSCSEQAQKLLAELGIHDEGVRQRLSLLFRARYHCVNRAVARLCVPQVLELASGISLRGLHWSRQYPGTVYIESDLSALMREKAKVLRDSIQDDCVSQRGVLHCCGIDALDLDSLRHALECTDPEAGLAIVTEGLLLYFTDEEMQRFLANMRNILGERPHAAWVVDLVSRQNLAELCGNHPSVATAVKGIFAATTREVIARNPFEDEGGIRDALHDHGLEVVGFIPLSEIAEQLPRADGISRTHLQSLCGTRAIWTIRPM